MLRTSTFRLPGPLSTQVQERRYRGLRRLLRLTCHATPSLPSPRHLLGPIGVRRQNFCRPAARIPTASAGTEVPDLRASPGQLREMQTIFNICSWLATWALTWAVVYAQAYWVRTTGSHICRLCAVEKARGLPHAACPSLSHVHLQFRSLRLRCVNVAQIVDFVRGLGLEIVSTVTPWAIIAMAVTLCVEYYREVVATRDESIKQGEGMKTGAGMEKKQAVHADGEPAGGTKFQGAFDRGASKNVHSVGEVQSETGPPRGAHAKQSRLRSRRIKLQRLRSFGNRNEMDS